MCQVIYESIFASKTPENKSLYDNINMWVFAILLPHRQQNNKFSHLTDGVCLIKFVSLILKFVSSFSIYFNDLYCQFFCCFRCHCLLRCPPLAANVPAAWRSGGLHYRLCGLLPFIFALPFPRGYCRRCAKPPVSCCRIVRQLTPILSSC